ncbi:TPM domain-containing protein [Zobellia roscoffensis]|uniref:TPM domain-containing protein n=1 Tax=Zobellia roscoffensis TaxID=2779508 RepID=UPI00293BB361|nr:TPM domain-containing protein [Zobellia roscoffensis]
MPTFNSFPENIKGTIINDFSEILSENEKANLTTKLYNYEVATTRQMIFVSIDKITPYTDIQKYATDLANHWGVGHKKKNNGLLLVLSVPSRKLGIATGLNTEKILTDSVCQQVIDMTIIPHFKEGNYYNGISKGLDSLIYKWDN